MPSGVAPLRGGVHGAPPMTLPHACPRGGQASFCHLSTWLPVARRMLTGTYRIFHTCSRE